MERFGQSDSSNFCNFKPNWNSRLYHPPTSMTDWNSYIPIILGIITVAISSSLDRRPRPLNFSSTHTRTSHTRMYGSTLTPQIIDFACRVGLPVINEQQILWLKECLYLYDEGLLNGSLMQQITTITPCLAYTQLVISGTLYISWFVFSPFTTIYAPFNEMSQDTSDVNDSLPIFFINFTDESLKRPSWR